MLEIRNDDGSINRTIFPVAMGSICNIMISNVTFINCTRNLENNSIFPFDTTVETYGNPNYDTYVPLYQSKGLGYTVKASNLPNNATTKLNPYIWFSAHIDEPLFATQNQTVKDDWNDSKAMFPNKLVIMNNYRDIISFAPWYNIFMNDAYANNPNFQNPAWCSPVCFYRSQLSYGQEALISGSGGIGNEGYQWNNSVWNNKSYWLQVNSQYYSNSQVTNPITETEIRNLLWTGIASGIQGVAFWGYLPFADYVGSPSGINGLSANLSMFNYYKNVSLEIMSLNDILILPTKTIFWYTDKNTSYTNITPNPTQSIYFNNINNLTYLTKQPSSNLTYLIAVNKDMNTSGNVQIKVGGMSGTQNVTFLGNATSGSGEATSYNASQVITATNGVFNDTFDGYAVHIYQISNVTSEGQSSGIPSNQYIINASGGNATWTSFTQENVTEDSGSHGIKMGIFADNFNDNDNTGWTTNAGTWSVSSGRLKQTNNASADSMAYYGATNFTNFEILATIKRTSEGSDDNSLVGLLGRKDTATRYYIFDSSNKATDIERIRYEVSYSGTSINTNNKAIATLNTDYLYRAKLNSSSLSMKYWQTGTAEPAWEIVTTNTTIVNGSVGIREYKNAIEVDDFWVRYSDSSGNVQTSGNFTSWKNWTDGNVTYQIDVNATTPANTNYSIWGRQNNTGNFELLTSENLTENTTIIIGSEKYQNLDVRVQLFGNETATPELTSITYYSQDTIDNYIPPIPTFDSISQMTNGNLGIDYYWSAGSGNITDGYNISRICLNSTWGIVSSGWVINQSYSDIGLMCAVGASHGYLNISIYAWNSSGSGTLNQTPLFNSSSLPNRAPVLGSIGNKNVTEGQWLNFTISATDSDSDVMTYGTNSTYTTFNTSTGSYNWSASGVGIYTWNFNVSDGYGGVDNETITVNVNALEIVDYTKAVFIWWD